MYEKKRIQELSMEKDKKEKTVVEEKVKPVVEEKVTPRPDEKANELDELRESLQKLDKLGKGTLGKKKPLIKIQDLKYSENTTVVVVDENAAASEEPIEKQVGITEIKKEEPDEVEETQEEPTENSTQNADDTPEPTPESTPDMETRDDSDVFVYLCPFPECDFQTDFNVRLHLPYLLRHSPFSY